MSQSTRDLEDRLTELGYDYIEFTSFAFAFSGSPDDHYWVTRVASRDAVVRLWLHAAGPDKRSCLLKVIALIEQYNETGIIPDDGFRR